MTDRYYSKAVVIALTAVLCLAFPINSTARVTEPDSTAVIAPGITYAQYSDNTPWAVQVITIERRNWKNLGVALGGPTVLGIEPLNRTIERLTTNAYPIEAAINGDFYQLAEGPFQGDPIGLCVTNGELVSSPVNPVGIYHPRRRQYNYRPFFLRSGNRQFPGKYLPTGRCQSALHR